MNATIIAEFATNAIVILPARHGELAGVVREAFEQDGAIVGARVEWTENDGSTYVTDHAPAALREIIPGDLVSTRPLPRESAFLRVQTSRANHPRRLAHAAANPAGCADWNCRLGCNS